MGHTRLGELPKSRKWRQVVGLVGAGAAAAQVATATLDAAGRAFALAADDTLFAESVWLLFRVPLAARSGDFAEALRECGLDVPDGPGLCDILAGLAGALDARTPCNKGRTDLGEVAQLAAIEALADAAGKALGASLFGVAPEDVRAAFASQATGAKFGALVRDFFARFADKWLGYYLSRTLGEQVGEGERFRTLADQERFEGALRTHCREVARVVEDYAADWQSKANWESGGDIDRESVGKFAAYAMEKLEAEFRRGGPA